MGMFFLCSGPVSTLSYKILDTAIWAEKITQADKRFWCVDLVSFILQVRTKDKLFFQKHSLF